MCRLTHRGTATIIPAMAGRRATWARRVLIGVLLCTLATTANAASTFGPPAGWPDLGAAALQTTDFSAGALVKTQRYVKPSSDSLAEYDREFKEGSVKLSGKRLLAFENDVSIGKTPSDAETLIAALPLGIALAANQIGKEFEKQVGVKPTYTRVGKATGLGVGNDSVGAIIRIGTKSGELRLVIAAIRLQQLDSAFFLMGLPRVKLGVPDAKVIARLSAKRIQAAMAPHDRAIPSIAGTVQVGQTQWDRCDTAGANCAPITGATAATYTVAAEDVGMTLRLDAGARNAYGASAPVSSAVTSAVPEPVPLTP